ncbi:FkbM family methyltransferase [Mucilaginibacter sp. RB4R14]|uniref:FkbM family methyltransferase n=1 Tax=Mucilaginibacter aurantiaciroseus TaxID=2949308 RepID=UPI0020914309|nr:FkbM family methyltransferase [Mucilaginibacter aurantiaciroseus]MCO5936053.1 FkbM family methyltransferase [Mucilaginibacter aurantiaciroseus]
MKRTDRIKLNFIRNWNLPGKERLAHFFSPSNQLKTQIKDGIVWLNTEDIAIYTTADNYIEWTILSTGTYEDEINKLIRISLKPGENALDIGGNIGLQSIRMSQCVGNGGKVYAFEPLNHLQEKFKKNVSLNKAVNVTLLPFALSDTETEAEFSINKNAWNQGTFSLNDSQVHTDKQTVYVKIADNLSEVQSLNHLALIKIDVEGYEYQVLRGLTNTLKQHKPRIIFEYDSNYWATIGQSIIDCTAFLLSLGYTLYQITSVGCELITDVKKIESGNLFCIPLK